MRITTVITCFNRQDRVGDAVRSALEQTLPPDEVLVIDDGSTDGSQSVLASFGSRIRVIKTANQGFPKALNLGVAEARGDWIAFLDSDDIWKSTKLERQVDALREFPESALVFCDVEALKQGATIIASRFALGGVYGAEAQRHGSLMGFDRSLFMRMIEESRIFTSCALVKRSIPELRFPEQFRCCIDWPVWMVLALRYPFAAVDEVLVRMHYDGDNLTARVGRILKNNWIFLSKLREDPLLTSEERAAVALACDSRWFAALYHSLVEGDNVAARDLLNHVPPGQIRHSKRLVYWCASRMPALFLRSLAKWRLKPSAG
jgi:glycosyltransferase involved in cell wall biosynthesis